MPEIVIYTQPFCGYCAAAMHLLNSKGVKWKEIDISENEKLREEMVKKARGQSTTPQIFINGKHIGGFSDLSDLEGSGKLDTLLQQ